MSRKFGGRERDKNQGVGTRTIGVPVVKLIHAQKSHIYMNSVSINNV